MAPRQECPTEKDIVSRPEERPETSRLQRLIVHEERASRGLRKVATFVPEIEGRVSTGPLIIRCM
jgi:hypothetical protein